MEPCWNMLKHVAYLNVRTFIGIGFLGRYVQKWVSQPIWDMFELQWGYSNHLICGISLKVGYRLAIVFLSLPWHIFDCTKLAHWGPQFWDMPFDPGQFPRENGLEASLLMKSQLRGCNNRLGLSRSAALQTLPDSLLWLCNEEAEPSTLGQRFHEKQQSQGGLQPIILVILWGIMGYTKIIWVTGLQWQVGLRAEWHRVPPVKSWQKTGPKLRKPQLLLEIFGESSFGSCLVWGVPWPWGYLDSWMVFVRENPIEMIPNKNGWFRVPPFMEAPICYIWKTTWLTLTGHVSNNHWMQWMLPLFWGG